MGISVSFLSFYANKELSWTKQELTTSRVTTILGLHSNALVACKGSSFIEFGLCKYHWSYGSQYSMYSLKFSPVVITQPFKVYAQDNFVIRGNTAVIKSVIPEHVRDYVRVLSWHIKLDVITLGGKYSLMPSGDLEVSSSGPCRTSGLRAKTLNPNP